MRTWMAALIAVLSVMSAVPEAQAAEAAPAVAAGGKVVVLASVKADKRWTGPGFDGIPEGSYAPNGCERSVAAGLRAAGFTQAEPELSASVMKRVRELRTVTRRYNDMSTLPGDTAAKIAEMLDPAAVAVVACGVVVSGPRQKEKQAAGGVCAEGHCKAVRLSDRRRVATASDTWCAPSGDHAPVGQEATQAVCAALGQQLGMKIGGR